MEQSKALEIDGQIIYGRDQFYLISTSQQENSFDVCIEVGSADENKKIGFSNTIFYSSTELDTYEQSNWSSSWLTSKSNFELVENSKLLHETVKLRTDYDIRNFHHYRISTYDYIIDVIAEGYRLETVGSNPTRSILPKGS